MEEKTLLEYWLVLYQKRFLIVAIIASSMITAGVLSKFIEPVYEAKAVFFVPKSPDTTTFFASPAGSMIRSLLTPVTREDDQAPYLGVLKSRGLAELVQVEYPHKTVGDLMHKDLDWVLTDDFLIEVYVRDKDPEAAAGIANAYVQYFNQIMGGYSLPQQSPIQDTLKQTMANHNKKLEAAKESLRELQAKNRTANIDEETRQFISQRSSFESQMETARVQYNENLQKITATQRELRREQVVFKASPITVTSALLEKLKVQLVDLEAQLASLLVERREAHPEVATLRQNYEQVRKNISLEVERIINSQIQTKDSFYETLRRDLVNLFVDNEKLRASIEGLRRVIQRIEERMQAIPGLKNQLDALNAEVTRYKGLVDTLTVNLEETKAQSARNPQVAVVVDTALPPEDPSFPNTGLNVAVAFFVGLLGGVFYVFFVGYIESTREKRVLKLLRAIEASEG